MNMKNCPICKGNELNVFSVIENRILLLCDDCRHIFWSSFPSKADLDLYYSSEYTDSYGQIDIQENNVTYYRNHLDYILSLIKKNSEDLMVCDYGCSIPVLLREAVKKGFKRSIGIDESLEAKLIGKDFGVEVISSNDVESYIEDESLDIVRFSHVLEHTIDPCHDLGLIVKKMKAGSVVHITQPNFPIFKADYSGLSLMDATYPVHLHFFSSLSLLRMIGNFPLKIIEFFSHHRAENNVGKYAHLFDYRKSVNSMSFVEEFGNNIHGEMGGYPYYFGENSCVYAVKTE